MERVSPENVQQFCQLALERLLRGNYTGARPYLLAARAATDAPSPLLLRLQGVCAAGIESFAIALPLLEAALDGYRLAEDVAGEAAAAGDLAAVAQRSGDLGRASQMIRWALDFADSCDAGQQTWLLLVAASVAALRGDVDQALADLEQAQQRAVAPFGPWVALQTATTLDLCGRSAEAIAAFEQAQQPALPGDTVSTILYDTARAWHSLLADNLASAYTACQRAIQNIHPGEYPVLRAPLQAIYGVIARERCQFAQAETLLAEAFAAMHAHGDAAGQFGVQWHQALCAYQQGHEDIALQHLAAVLDGMSAAGYGTTLLWQPAHFAKLCHWALDSGWQHMHIDWLLGHSLAPWANARAVGASATTCSLTQREQEIATSLAQGLKDREIAEQLRISHRTVHAHLRQIYAKLGVNNRATAIQALLVQHDPAQN